MRHKLKRFYVNVLLATQALPLTVAKKKNTKIANFLSLRDQQR